MNWTQLKPLLGKIAVVAAGVLVANQVQKLMDKSRLMKPKEA
jgi:hypothetical protein